MASTGRSEDAVGHALDHPLPPPDLVVQDELHLVSGPLGTMVGLYETAIDALCATPAGGAGVRPKIVASTATVRRAERQIRGLFGRADVDIFSAAGTRQTELLLREDRRSGGAQPSTVRGHRRSGPEPEGGAAADLPGAAVRWAEDVAGVLWIA